MTRLTYMMVLCLAAAAMAVPRRLNDDDYNGYSDQRNPNQKECTRLTKEASRAAQQINNGVSMVQDLTPYNTLSQTTMAMANHDCDVSLEITQALMETQRRMAEELRGLPKASPGMVDCRLIDKQVAKLVENYESLKAKGGDVTHVKAMLDAMKEHTDSAGCRDTLLSPVTPPATTTTSEDVLALKRRYLASLSSHELVELIMQLDQDREMPIFPLDLTPVSRSHLENGARKTILRENGTHMARRREDDGGAPSYDDRHVLDGAAGDAPSSPVLNGASVALPYSSAPTSTSRAPHLSFLLSTPSAPPPHPTATHPLPSSALTDTNANTATPPIIRSPSPYPPFHENPSSSQHHQNPDYPSPPVAGGPSAALARSSWDTGMPSYEEMICMALVEIADPEASAHQALQKTFKRGRLQKIGSKYRLNPGWSGGTTSRRTTRRPQAAAGATAPVLPFSATTTRGGFSATNTTATNGNGNSWHTTLMPGLSHSLLPSHHHAPQRQPYPSYHSHPQPHPPSMTSMHPHPPHHQEVFQPPGVALLQAIAGINGMIDHDHEQHEDREEEDHGDADEDAEGEMEMEQMEVDGAGGGATTEDDEPEGGRGRKAEEQEEGSDDEDGGDPQSALKASLKASLLDLAAQLKMASASTSNPAAIPPVLTTNPAATTTATT
ncbi:hypothetical protein FRB97_006727 [Tulasnella sp. 331]|nr:hypothetical protein FRB97_006727 [Tulasnella sp. 331]KAG8877417.1 hypothetical protein FRB98_006699 [Tulasnella sp. 332]